MFFSSNLNVEKDIKSIGNLKSRPSMDSQPEKGKTVICGNLNWNQAVVFYCKKITRTWTLKFDHHYFITEREEKLYLTLFFVVYCVYCKQTSAIHKKKPTAFVNWLLNHWLNFNHYWENLNFAVKLRKKVDLRGKEKVLSWYCKSSSKKSIP